MPLHTWGNDLAMLPVVAIFGILQTSAIMRYVESRSVLHNVNHGFICGVIDAALALIFILLFSMVWELGAVGWRKIVDVLLLCFAFIFPPILSPRILSIVVSKINNPGK